MALACCVPQLTWYLSRRGSGVEVHSLLSLLCMEGDVRLHYLCVPLHLVWDRNSVAISLREPVFKVHCSRLPALPFASLPLSQSINGNLPLPRFTRTTHNPHPQTQATSKTPSSQPNPQSDPPYLPAHQPDTQHSRSTSLLPTPFHLIESSILILCLEQPRALPPALLGLHSQCPVYVDTDL